MAETVKIAELAIDNKKLLSTLQQTKKSIDELTNTQKQLKQAGDTSSKTFIENEVQLKALKQEYNSQIKVLQATTGANEKLTKAINEEVKGVDQAKANNAELVRLRNQVNSATEEGAAAIAEINEKIDRNNQLINTNSSELEQQKQNIGNYKEDIKGAAEELDVFNGGLGGMIQKSSESGGALGVLKGAMGGAVQGFLGLTKASLAFIATPIGALLAVLVGAFALIKNAMDRSEESTNKIKKAFSAFRGITNGLLKILEPLGEFLIDGLVKGFELAEKAVYKGLETISKGLKLLGFDDAATNLDKFNNKIKEAATTSKALADAEAQLTKAQRESQKIQLEYQKNAEKLRQIRDNENLTMAERIKANEDLGKVLKQQLNEELKIAQLALQTANLRIQAEGETKEALDEQAEALTTIADIQERITGQESEQLTNRVSLQKEAAEKAKEIADKAIARQEAELQLFIEQQGRKAKTLEEGLNIARQVADKEIEILQANLKNKNITQEEYDAEYLRIKNDLLEQNAQLAVDNAQRELDAYIQNHQSKIDNDLFFSEESLRIESERLNAIAEKRREFAKTQLDEGVINQQEYNDAINEINEENRVIQEELKAEREEAEAEKQIADIEYQRELMGANFDYNLQAQLDYLEFQKKQELDNAEKTGADKTAIEKKYADLETQIKRQTVQNKLDLASGALGNIAQIAGEESAIGKGAAVAQATIDTYKSATSAFSALSGIPIVGPALGAVAAAAAVAAGIANVKKILSTKAEKKYARGGILNGASHAAGGISTPFGELEGGEAVINKRSTAMFAPLLSSLNVAGGGRKFASGGILGSTDIPKATSLIDYDLLGSKMAEANQSLPSPVVSVEEINSVNNGLSVIETQATF
ncbi:hypothetical protein [Corallibacter sp.]|uniref:hypothetical protein n=1 Tax=Corallibacter sp. TaxID=2038084 RepID=UPI003AB19425